MSDETQPKTIGELLKQGRLRQKLSIVECSKRTHISLRFLEALEAERWNDLPSESHRLGFLRAYSRFLGVSADETMLLYQKGKDSNGHTASRAAEEATPRGQENSVAPVAHRRSWFPGSWEQLVGVLIVLLIAFWGIFHAVSRREGSEPHINLWTRPRAHQTRLMAPKPTTTVQKVRVHAQTDSWLRVTEVRHLLFEGILPAGATKEWTGQGPFMVRLGNVQAVNVFWNDQPVSLAASSHGMIADLQLPLAKGPETPPATSP